jgi:uroporphyrinogen decarboxylase-like protein
MEQPSSKALMDQAMRMGRPERTPVMCQLSLGHYFLNCDRDPTEIWHSTEGFGEALVLLRQRYGFDGILVNLPGRNPKWRSYISRLENNGEETVIHWVNGATSICPPDDNPHVYGPDGNRFEVSFADLDPAQLYYVEPHDLGGLSYPFCWSFSNERAERGSFFPSWHFDTIDYVVSRVGGSVSVHGEVFSPFTQFLELLDYTNGLMALLDDPGKCRACLEALAEGTIALGKEQAAHGVDALLISSAFAGAGFISPDQYREFVLPYEKMVIDGIRRDYDLPIYTHTCGSIGDRLDLLEATGTNGIVTLDPPPLGDVELREAKAAVGARLFLKGNLDPVNVLLGGSPELVFAEAIRCLDTAAPEGAYILSSACSISPHTRPGNILALRSAVEEWSSARN